jgi:hypothetical protein
MKTLCFIRRLSFICLIIIPAHGLQAQTKGNAELLTGTWTLDLENSLNKMSAAGKSRYAKLEGAGRQMFIDAYSGRRLTFYDNGSFLQQQTKGIQVSGKWLLQQDGQTLLITSPKGKTLSLRVEMPSDDKMILHQQNTGGIIMILTDWYLTKNK